MCFIDYNKREINLKILLCGPVGCGKEEIARFIHESAPLVRGKMITLATEGERTVFFDIPFSAPSVRGFSVRVHVYTVPSQGSYKASRDLILTGADAAILVVPSGLSRVSENESFFHAFQGWLKEKRYTTKEPRREYTLEDIVMFFLCNLSKGGDGINPGRIRERLNIEWARIFDYSQEKQQGALECLKATAKEVLLELTATDEGERAVRSRGRSQVVEMLGGPDAVSQPNRSPSSAPIQGLPARPYAERKNRPAVDPLDFGFPDHEWAMREAERYDRIHVKWWLAVLSPLLFVGLAFLLGRVLGFRSFAYVVISLFVLEAAFLLPVVLTNKLNRGEARRGHEYRAAFRSHGYTD